MGAFNTFAILHSREAYVYAPILFGYFMYTAALFDLRAQIHLVGPCMRCLTDAEVDVGVTAREFHDPDAPVADELRSDYVARRSATTSAMSWTTTSASRAFKIGRAHV
mgnify:CR=1 FL=1